ncbi:sulfate permease [Halomonas sp. MCCC 1A17488]|uniref:Sulfate permease n=1 Tax=Billgrantia sulfidoxydans TaxID=2733484 RepID=A0ABX7W6P2_9GAMM|nr:MULTISPECIES: sulfate permease [Halomonas]MCE8018117.1 sulfate permease [Halomonas sp. MCCC 1A17488]MCG3241450.1 sulfate permease [Halomonas sp. MCCC 1A17488]QPP48591.1 sulfate permease [Halomonas sp. SS10-MC5]QTP55936.1 sulfate permease [Halomonas sulfidoxydans]
MSPKRYLPILQWLPGYGRATLASDLLAAVIVTIMLIPQSLAYAMLAGLPPEVGLYASIAPLAVYAVFGTSRTLAVGPVAVVSLMTAAAVGQIAPQGSPEYLGAALVLALMSGLILTLMGIARLGFLANFLSHPVISGFITASGLIIAASQLKHVLGVEASGHNLLELLVSLGGSLEGVNGPTLVIGFAVLAFLHVARRWLKHGLGKLGIPARPADMLTKAAPILAVAVTALATWSLGLDAQGVAVVGTVPAGLPPLTLPGFDGELWGQLFVSALLISVIGFVESVSVGQTLAAKRRQRIDPDQELVGLGTSNIAASLTGGMPVTGGFARSVVNFDAGAETPAAGAFTAVGIAVAALLLTPLIAYLPIATLAATIIVAVLSLVDIKAMRHTWNYSRSDALAMFATVGVTLGHGVESGILAGVGLSLALHLYNTSRPHSAVVGRVPGTEHFRNVKRHRVETDPRLAILRVDESLYFANSRYLEDLVMSLAAREPGLEHIVLACQAVNRIDASALESLEAINTRLRDAGVKLHLAEVKGPVMDRLKHTDFCHDMTGLVFLSTFDAWRYLRGETQSPGTSCGGVESAPLTMGTE